MSLPAVNSNLTKIKSYMGKNEVKSRFVEALGESRSRTFMASIVNAVSGNKKLMTCSPETVLGASFVAASLDLPIDQNLGYAAIVPYEISSKVSGQWVKTATAQFQMMYKGFVQLAVRSGQYRDLSSVEIYEDELESYDPIFEQLLFTGLGSRSQRNNNETDKIIGYCARFSLLSGFNKILYMPIGKIREHAEKYSSAFQYDLKQKKQASKWSTDFDVMAKKTVLKLLLSRWGILSVDIQKAIESDQQVITANEKGNILDIGYVDNQPQLHHPTSSLDNKETPIEEPKKGTTVWDFEGDPESRVPKEKMAEIIKILEANDISFNHMREALAMSSQEVKNCHLAGISEYVNSVINGD